MKKPLKHDLRTVAAASQTLGGFRGAEPYGSGHINDTDCTVFEQAGLPVRYILLRINPQVFRNPVALRESIQRVTEQVAAKVAGREDATRRTLPLVPAREGRAWHRDADGHNLDRGRTQFRLVESIEEQETQMNELVETIE